GASITAQVTSTFDTSLALVAANCTTETTCRNATTGGETISIGNLAQGKFYLVVEGVAGATGSFSIVYTAGPPRPPNDQCTGAIALTAGAAPITGSLSNGLNDAMGTCGGSAGVDVVYS